MVYTPPLSFSLPLIPHSIVVMQLSHQMSSFFFFFIPILSRIPLDETRGVGNGGAQRLRLLIPKYRLFILSTATE